MSGSYNSIDFYQDYPDGDRLYFTSTGMMWNPLTVQHGINHSITYEDFWNQMYIKPKPVIIVCAYCKCHNVISSPACIQCGAPMGYGTERQYG